MLFRPCLLAERGVSEEEGKVLLGFNKAEDMLCGRVLALPIDL